jgi:4-hydroxybenzoate polyprenyltransferase
MNTPQDWMSVVSKAAITLLLAAVAAFVAWQLLKVVLPALLVILVIVVVYRIGIGGHRRSGW